MDNLKGSSTLKTLPLFISVSKVIVPLSLLANSSIKDKPIPNPAVVLFFLVW